MLRSNTGCLENEFEVIDFMPRFKKENGKYYTPPEIVRILKLIKGVPLFKVLYDPRLAFASGTTNTYVKENFIVSIVDDEKYETLFLYSNLKKEAIINSTKLKLSEDIYFVISYNEKINLPDLDKVLFELDQTKIYWKKWCYKTPLFKHYNNEILRSAMTLKLMNFEKTGAIINTDDSGFAQYKKMKSVKLTERQELDKIKEDIEEIKFLLKQIISK